MFKESRTMKDQITLIRKGIIIQLVVLLLYFLIDYIKLGKFDFILPSHISIALKTILLLYLVYSQVSIFILLDLLSKGASFSKHIGIKVLRIGLGILGLVASFYLGLWLIQLKNSVLMVYATFY